LKFINEAFNNLDSDHSGFIEMDQLKEQIPDFKNIDVEEGAVL